MREAWAGGRATGRVLGAEGHGGLGSLGCFLPDWTDWEILIVPKWPSREDVLSYLADSIRRARFDHPRPPPLPEPARRPPAACPAQIHETSN